MLQIMEKLSISFDVDSDLSVLVDDLCKYFCVSRNTICYYVFKCGLYSMFRLTSHGLKVNVTNTKFISL